MAVGVWGMRPKEFWRLHPTEFWWLVEAKRPPTMYGDLTEDDAADLLDMLEDGEDERTDG